MKVLDWDDSKMSVTIELIDNHHKKLLNIINELYTTIRENSQKKDILIIVDKLIKYTQYHFSVEEAYFEKFDFKESDSHKKEHTHFINMFQEIKDTIEKSKINMNKSAINLAEDIFKYLVNWFINHVTKCDKEYIELFKENGIK